MLSSNSVIKNIERMDRLINEHDRKLKDLEANEEVLNLLEKIERYNTYKEQFIHPKKGMSQVVSNKAIIDSIQDFQDRISSDILLCFYSKEK